MTHDWDNIPPVVPRFVIHLSKYIEGITDHVKHLKALETVESLRIDTTGKFEVRQPSFIPNRRFLCSRTWIKDWKSTRAKLMTRRRRWCGTSRSAMIMASTSAKSSKSFAAVFIIPDQSASKRVSLKKRVSYTSTPPSLARWSTWRRRARSCQSCVQSKPKSVMSRCR